jgi:hypothetical protein
MTGTCDIDGVLLMPALRIGVSGFHLRQTGTELTSSVLCGCESIGRPRERLNETARQSTACQSTACQSTACQSIGGS